MVKKAIKVDCEIVGAKMSDTGPYWFRIRPVGSETILYDGGPYRNMEDAKNAAKDCTSSNNVRIASWY